jgi:hypothetical protein
MRYLLDDQRSFGDDSGGIYIKVIHSNNCKKNRVSLTRCQLSNWEFLTIYVI